MPCFHMVHQLIVLLLVLFRKWKRNLPLLFLVTQFTNRVIPRMPDIGCMEYLVNKVSFAQRIRPAILAESPVHGIKVLVCDSHESIGATAGDWGGLVEELRG